MIHGIGRVCDLYFRPLVAVVDDFRASISDLIAVHYQSQVENNENTKFKNRRIEVLPISWHSALHTAELDSQIECVTLPSIPKIRAFTNDTILDALFYVSFTTTKLDNDTNTMQQTYQERIIEVVAMELNRRFGQFLKRNPFFGGTIALGGHSLGSLILYDLLSRQGANHNDLNCQVHPQQQLHFRPSALFAMGSPIAAFLIARGQHAIEPTFRLPTCPAMLNIFHPNDPIAYRIEPMIDPNTASFKPVLMEHYKGRKRLHLELRDGIVRLSKGLRRRALATMTTTIHSLYSLVNLVQSGLMGSEVFELPIDEDEYDEDELKGEGENEAQIEKNLLKLENDTKKDRHECEDKYCFSLNDNTEQKNTTSGSLHSHQCQRYLSREEREAIAQANFGALNSGRRIDYALQQRTIEAVNDYASAIVAHLCYWMSRDTALLMLRELYRGREDGDQNDNHNRRV